ncbi:MAG: acyltransferase [Bacteroidota bacterium]
MKADVHLKGLNGIRAIAAMAVVIFHIGVALQDFGFASNMHTDLGGHGVSMFFALSGFLITYLLLIEKNRFNGINIKSFYIRRVLRIWPLYYFYMFLALLTIYFYSKEQLPNSYIYYLLMAGNIPYIFDFSYPVLIHFWSLGVEEQFYAFWPWVVKKSNNLLRFLFIFTIAFLVAKFFFRYLYSVSDYKWPYLAWHITRFDCMSIGAIGAIFFLKENKRFLHLASSVFSQIVAWGVIALVLFNQFHIASIIDTEIIAVLTVILIVNVAGNKKTMLNLEKPVFNFLGKISYGIYVYHPLIIFFAARWLKSFLNSFDYTYKLIFVYALVPLCTILIAYLSYNYLEKRFLKLKTGFSRVQSSDTAEELPKAELFSAQQQKVSV